MVYAWFTQDYTPILSTLPSPPLLPILHPLPSPSLDSTPLRPILPFHYNPVYFYAYLSGSAQFNPIRLNNTELSWAPNTLPSERLLLAWLHKPHLGPTPPVAVPICLASTGLEWFLGFRVIRWWRQQRSLDSCICLFVIVSGSESISSPPSCRHTALSYSALKFCPQWEAQALGRACHYN